MTTHSTVSSLRNRSYNKGILEQYVVLEIVGGRLPCLGLEAGLEEGGDGVEAIVKGEQAGTSIQEELGEPVGGSVSAGERSAEAPLVEVLWTPTE